MITDRHLSRRLREHSNEMLQAVLGKETRFKEQQRFKEHRMASEHRMGSRSIPLAVPYY